MATPITPLSFHGSGHVEHIDTHQRNGWVATKSAGRQGKMLREEHVGGERYIAVRWSRRGVSVYRVLRVERRDHDGDAWTCVLLMGGLGR